MRSRCKYWARYFCGVCGVCVKCNNGIVDNLLRLITQYCIGLSILQVGCNVDLDVPKTDLFVILSRIKWWARRPKELDIPAQIGKLTRIRSRGPVGLPCLSAWWRRAGRVCQTVRRGLVSWRVGSVRLAAGHCELGRDREGCGGDGYGTLLRRRLSE